MQSRQARLKPRSEGAFADALDWLEVSTANSPLFCAVNDGAAVGANFV